MTLILAGIVDDAVIVATDTKVGWASSPTGPVTSHGNDEKLFIVRGCAVASFGSNNPETIPHFPAVMHEISGDVVGPETLSSDLYKLLANRASLSARLVVGGIGTNGPELWEVNPEGVDTPTRRLLPKPGKEASVRGVQWGTCEADSQTTESLLAWMKGRLAEIAAAPQYADMVGPPFKYVELRAGQAATIKDL
jgi:hypothetical protein